MRRTPAALALLALLACLPAAMAHAVPVDLTPAQGAVLPDSPEEITVRMSQRVDPSASRVELLDAESQPVATGAVSFSQSDHVLTVLLPEPLPRGGYIVKWQVLSVVDGHTTQGSWSFAVGDAAIPEVADGYTSPSFRVDAIVGKTLLYAGTLLLVGALVFVAWPLAGRADGLPHLGILLGAGGAALAAGALLYAASQWGASGLTPGQYYLETTFGRSVVARTLLALVAGGLAVLSWRRDWNASAAAWAVALPLAAMLLVQSLFGHPAEFMPAGFLGTILDLAHMLVVGAWIGGLVPLGLYLKTMASLEEPGRLHATARRFSTLATVGVAAATVTGLWMSLVLVGPDLATYTTTAYGRALAVKVLLVVPVITVLGAVNRLLFLRSTTRPLDTHGFRRNVWREVAVAGLVLLAAGTVTNLNPPAGDEGGPTVLPRATFFNETRGDTYLYHLYIDPGPQPGAESRIEMHVLDPETFRFVDGHSLQLFLEHPDTGEFRVPVTPLNETGKYEARGAFFSAAGEWSATIDFRHATTGREQVTITVPVEP